MGFLLARRDIGIGGPDAAALLPRAGLLSRNVGHGNCCRQQQSFQKAAATLQGL
jgi:hypothetical protein